MDLIDSYYLAFDEIARIDFMNTTEKELMENIEAYGEFLIYLENTDPYVRQQIKERAIKQ